MPYQYFGYIRFLQTYAWLIAFAILWSLPWKGYALWRAARNSSPRWFVALLLVNTLAVLDILYIFVFSKQAKAKRKALKKDEPA